MKEILDIDPQLSTFGKTLSYAALQRGEFKSNHRLLSSTPWIGGVDKMWRACQTLDSTCTRTKGKSQSASYGALGKQFIYLQVLFQAQQFRCEAEIWFTESIAMRVKGARLTLIAEEATIIQALIAQYQKFGGVILERTSAASL